ncbi:hypothetical protein PYJP_00590 [Pyrofollis japonicus]|jgi:chaperonin cofactor prefoldin|uniref:prefoldin subunit n=1 Tax=Pyrofollis japonicus TaxID=3060460 RepID=UPI00295A9522|nr:prefoldin subunit [Pyrofollis japonicus]BEP16707.1 hypothetical protein PYJP_00590 [Pyrofollis japonicus]
MSKNVAGLLELLQQLNSVRREIVLLRSRIHELREAKKILENREPRQVFREIGGLVIEVSLEDAMRYIDDELELLELRLKKLEEEEKKLSQQIRELEKALSIGP